MREDQRRKAVAPNTTLFVVNFDPLETDERDMRDYFGKFGDLDRVQIKKNFAFIQVCTPQCLPAAPRNMCQGPTIAVWRTSAWQLH